MKRMTMGLVMFVLVNVATLSVVTSSTQPQTHTAESLQRLELAMAHNFQDLAPDPAPPSSPSVRGAPSTPSVPATPSTPSAPATAQTSHGACPVPKLPNPFRVEDKWWQWLYTKEVCVRHFQDSILQTKFVI